MLTGTSQILGAAYASIKPKARNSSSGADHAYLADNAVRETFAAGVIELLQHEPAAATRGFADFRRPGRS